MGIIQHNLKTNIVKKKKIVSTIGRSREMEYTFFLKKYFVFFLGSFAILTRIIGLSFFFLKDIYLIGSLYLTLIHHPNDYFMVE